MRIIKNYIVVYYNQMFHIKNPQEKENQLRCMFSGYDIKDVCFNTKQKPMAYVYFGQDGEARKVVNGFLDLPNQFEFKVQLGEEKTLDADKVCMPRSIIIDGESVAREHGIGRLFSTQGLNIAINYFESQQRCSDVNVVLSEKRFDFSSAYIPTLSKNALYELKNKNMITVTKNGIYDENFIKEQVIKKRSVIVSNDKFRDDQFRNSPEIVSYFNGPNILQFAFNDDEFLPLYAATKPSETVGITDLNLNILDDEDVKRDEPNEIGFNKIYVKGIPKEYKKTNIERLFETCGSIADVFIFNNSNNSFTGSCTVTFVNNESAKKAVDNMNRKQVENSNLSVERYIPKNERPEPFTLYVWPIKNNVADHAFKNIFGTYGDLLDVIINKAKQCAFVSYRDKSSADQAIQNLNQKMIPNISDRPLKVAYRTRKN